MHSRNSDAAQGACIVSICVLQSQLKVGMRFRGLALELQPHTWCRISRPSSARHRSFDRSTSLRGSTARRSECKTLPLDLLAPHRIDNLASCLQTQSATYAAWAPGLRARILRPAANVAYGLMQCGKVYILKAGRRKMAPCVQHGDAHVCERRHDVASKAFAGARESCAVAIDLIVPLGATL